jgi:glycosyltransferase involved in cell wall biosynthesis
MTSKVIVHISADFPDCMVAAKTSSVRNLLDNTDGYRHIVYSLNRVNRVSGIVAVDFGPDRKALAYGAMPAGVFLKTFLDRVSNWILDDLKAQNIQVDALHLHKFSVEGLIGLNIAHALKCPFIVNIWGDTDLKIVNARKDLAASWRAILDESALIIPCAPWAEESFERKFGMDLKKSVIVAPIVQHERFDPAPVISQPRFVTLFNLDSHTRKNFSFLVQAIMREAQETPDITLDVYGKGSPKTNFELREIIDKAGAQQHVLLKGPLPNDNFIKTLQNYVAFLMPSRRETFGMVFIEALFAGLPLLYTKHWGIDGFFESNDVGYACDSAQVEDVWRGVNFLLKNQAALKRNIASLSERGGLDRFTRDQIVATYKAGLERVFASRQTVASQTQPSPVYQA